MEIANTIVGIFGKVLDKFVADKDQRNQLLAEMQKEILANESQIVALSSANVKSEIEGKSSIQRSWRPILMLVIVTIIANNFLLAPYVHLFFGVDVAVPLPDDLYNLMNIGVGGYVVGRSVEKSVKHYKGDSIK